MQSWSVGLGAGAVTGCSGDYLPFCSDVSSRYRVPTGLTDTPSFTASQIASRDPLAVEVPVNEHTAETNGAEIVRLPMSDTDLVPGVYFADTI